jgi:hypothetical protein
MKSFFRHWSSELLSGLRRRFSEREEAEALAYVLTAVLKMSAREAAAAARACVARRAKLYGLAASGKPERALRALARMRPAFDVEAAARDLERHASPSCLLALPLTASSLLLLAGLSRKDARRRLLILNTPLASVYLRPIVGAGGDRGASFLSSSEMVTHSRLRREGDGEAVTYVTFPDHQITRGDTMCRTRFLGEGYWFSTLEPLLFFRGAAPLITVGVEASDRGGCLKLVSYPHAGARGEVTGGDVGAVPGWLAEQMEAVFRHAPADVLSWEYVYARSERMRARVAVLKLKEVEGYLHAWRSADARFDAEIHGALVNELRELQDALNSPTRSARAEHGREAVAS